MLTVICATDSRKNRNVVFKCQCDCGRFVEYTWSAINASRAKSCGCVRGPKPVGCAAINIALRQYKQSAARRGYQWLLPRETAILLFSRPCYYCGSPPSNVARDDRLNGKQFVYNGIDRLNPSLGYVEGNVVACCSTCNFAKMRMTEHEFIDWIDRVYAHAHSHDPSAAGGAAQ